MKITIGILVVPVFLSFLFNASINEWYESNRGSDVEAISATYTLLLALDYAFSSVYFLLIGLFLLYKFTPIIKATFATNAFPPKSHDFPFQLPKYVGVRAKINALFLLIAPCISFLFCANISKKAVLIYSSAVSMGGI